MEGARWWMGCQPHIRVLRGVVRSRVGKRDVEASLHKCVSLYMADIHEHSVLEDEKVLLVISGGQVTAMEASFMWLGGWRPSCALMLVYSLMGVQLRDEIRSFGLGIKKLVRSEAVLSDKQLVSLRNVQNRARDEEKKLSKKLASIQMLISDQDVVAAVMLESSPDRTRKTDLRTVLKPRMSRLKKLLIQADQLRLQTLHQLFLVLSPIQVAHCAIAAFELAFSMHALGVSDESRIQAGSSIPCAKPVPPRLPSRNPLGFDSLKQPVCVLSTTHYEQGLREFISMSSIMTALRQDKDGGAAHQIVKYRIFRRCMEPGGQWLKNLHPGRGWILGSTATFESEYIILRTRGYFETR